MIQSCTVAQIGRALDVGREALAFGGEIAAVALPAGRAVFDGRAAVGSPIMDRPHVDLAETRRDRAHARLGAERQGRFGLRQTLVDLLAGEVDVEFVA